MSKQPSPRLDALRAMREAAFAKVKTPRAPRPSKPKAARKEKP